MRRCDLENKIEFKVNGKYALFTDPLTKIGGEKCSYQIPTYQSLKGITESMYWKPTFTWYIDKVRIIKAIRTETKSTKPLKYGGGNDLSIYTYLANVEYQIQAHFEWNKNRTDLEKDRNENKHYFVSKRMIERGGRRDIFLGSRECQGYLEPCKFGEGKGFYDEYGDLQYDLMFHGFNYPDETGINELHARFWKPILKNGVLEFIRPEKCTISKFVKEMIARSPNTVGLDEVELLDEYDDQEIKL
jgi:CRISPR-associated protein Cas5d